MCRFASRCFIAWKLPIGRPNCTRSLAYCTVTSQHVVGRPDLLRGLQHGGDGEGSLPQRQGRLARCADDGGQRDGHVVEAHLGQPAREVEAGERTHGHAIARRRRRHEHVHEPDVGAWRRRAGIGHRRPVHVAGDAAQAQPIAVGLGGHLDAGRVGRAVPGGAPGREQPAGGEPRQHRGPLRLGAERGDGVRDDVGGDERAGVQHPPQLLGQHHRSTRGWSVTLPPPCSGGTSIAVQPRPAPSRHTSRSTTSSASSTGRSAASGWCFSRNRRVLSRSRSWSSSKPSCMPSPVLPHQTDAVRCRIVSRRWRSERSSRTTATATSGSASRRPRTRSSCSSSTRTAATSSGTGSPTTASATRAPTSPGTGTSAW